MPKEPRQEIKLPSLDELFSSQEEREDAKLKRIYEIPPEEIDPFPDHPYKVKDDEDMMNLIESVRANGIITPAVIRKKEDGRYEMLSGHRRLRACELAGIPTLRCEIVEMSRDEAVIFMIDSNCQRTEILPSEKAFAYKMRLEAMKRLPGRPAQKCGPVVHNNDNEKSRDELGELTGESGRTISRYIRLTELIPALLERVDNREIALRPAVELSYFPKDVQTTINEQIEIEQCTPSHAQAIRMRRMHEEGKLTNEAIAAIMGELKPNQIDRIVIKTSKLNSLFPEDLPATLREDYVYQALKFYREHQRERFRRRSRDDDAR